MKPSNIRASPQFFFTHPLMAFHVAILFMPWRSHAALLEALRRQCLGEEGLSPPLPHRLRREVEWEVGHSPGVRPLCDSITQGLATRTNNRVLAPEVRQEPSCTSSNVIKRASQCHSIPLAAERD